MSEKRSEEHVEPLLKAANEAAQHVQNVYLTFLLLSTYIAIIIWSTTDEQLLKVSSVNLPLLNVPLPIVGFYSFIPWLFLLLHFNLLLQFYLLACKLHALEAGVVVSDDGTVWEQQTAKLFPFPFSHMLIGRYRRRIVRFLLAVVVGTTVLLLPPFLLTWMQVRFLPYHDGVITWIQRAAVWGDLMLLWVFWPMTMAAGTVQEKTRREPENVASQKSWIRYLHKIKAGWHGLHTRTVAWNFFLVLTSLIFFVFSLAVAVLPGGERWPFRHLTDLLFDAPGTHLHRNLRLGGKILLEKELSADVASGLRSQNDKIKEAAMKHVVPLNLANRDLRFADFRNAVLSKVDLRGANLNNARLEYADLSGADLRPFDVNDGGSCIQEAQEESLSPEDQSAAGLIDVNIVTDRGKKGRFCSTSLQGANLSAVALENGRLPYVQLQGAILRTANLSKANIWKARLQNTDLLGARFRESDLRYAQLQGAYLGYAQLQGANLSDAQLQGVSSSLDMEAQGANFTGTHFEGATLQQARLEGAILFAAKLQGTFLEGARLQGAYLWGARLQGADLSRAQLQGADLGLSAIGGANFRWADLSLSDMADVDREPLTPKVHKEIEKSINEAKIRDKQRRESGLRRLTMAVGQWDTLEKASRAEDMLCGWNSHSGTHAPVFLQGCIPGKEFERYERKVLPFLAKLGCDDRYVARGMYYRATESKRGGSTLGAELAKQLLDASCEGGKSLSEREKSRLKQIIEGDKQMRSKRPPSQ